MAQQTSVRDAESDILLSPLNSVFAFIDYQPEQFAGVTSRDHEELMMNVVTLGKIARDFSAPVVLSTVAVQMGANSGTVRELVEVLPETEEIDRTTMNAWEDEDFLNAIKATGKKKIIIAGLWTEVCVAFPVLDALNDGYEVYFVTDAIGGVTKETHETAVSRMIQAGAKPVTTFAIACEFQRDWSREHGNTLRTLMRGYFKDLRELNPATFS